jgi:hypothetical protein
LWFVSQAGWRTHEHEAQGALGVVNRKASGDETAAGTTHYDGGFVLDRVHECCQIIGEISDPVTSLGAASITVASLCQSKGMDMVRQVS